MQINRSKAMTAIMREDRETRRGALSKNRDSFESPTRWDAGKVNAYEI
jgi:hypothetical protein